MPKVMYVVPYGIKPKTFELRARGFRKVEKALKFARKKNMLYIFAQSKHYKGRIEVATGEVTHEVRDCA